MLSRFSLTYGLDTRMLFSDHVVYHLFGITVSYPVALTLFMAGLFVLFTFLAFRRYMRGKANQVR